MRKHLRAALPVDPETRRTPRTTADYARAALVASHGPRASSWLIWQHKRDFHLRGAVDFKIPEKPNKTIAERLRWFFVAMDFLRDRPLWDVQVTTRKGSRFFRVRWLGWKVWGAQKAVQAS